MPLTPQQELRLLRVIDQAQAAGDVQGELRALKVMDEANAEPDPAPVSGALDAMMVGAGEAATSIGRGIRDLYGRYTDNPELRQQVRQEVEESNRLMAPVREQYPVSTAVGSALPYMAVPTGAATGLLARGASAVAPRAAAALGGRIPAAVAPIADAALTGAAIGAIDPNQTAAGGAAGGLLGGVVGQGVSKAISPLAARVAASGDAPTTEIATRLGFKLTPSQLAGGRPGWIERGAKATPIVQGAVDRFGKHNQKVANRIAARAIGENTDELTPKVLNQADERIGKVFDDIAAKGDINLDQQFVDDLANIEATYGRSLVRGDSTITNTLDNALEYAAQGRVKGSDYLNMVSDLRKVAEGKMRGEQSNPAAGRALFEVKEALDNAMERTLGAADRAKLQQARGEYRSLMQLLRPGIVDGGDVSLVKLGNHLKRRDVKGYMLGRNESDLYDAVRVARDTRDLMPQSGTTPRLMDVITGTTLGGGLLAPMLYDVSGTSALAVPGLLAGGRLGAEAWMRGGANQLMTRPSRFTGGTLGESVTGLAGRAGASTGLLDWLQDEQGNER